MVFCDRARVLLIVIIMCLMSEIIQCEDSVFASQNRGLLFLNEWGLLVLNVCGAVFSNFRYRSTYVHTYTTETVSTGLLLL